MALIAPGCPELDACTCGDQGIIVKPGDKVRTDFYKNEADKIRIVKSVYPAPHHSQSGFYIQTTDNLSCDAGWYREA
jgi:hypothetical protein